MSLKSRRKRTRKEMEKKKSQKMRRRKKIKEDEQVRGKIEEGREKERTRRKKESARGWGERKGKRVRKERMHIGWATSKKKTIKNNKIGLVRSLEKVKYKDRDQTEKNTLMGPDRKVMNIFSQRSNRTGRSGPVCKIKEYITYVHMISFSSPMLPTT